MLYYISNVSDEQEQLLYFGLFFFSYSFSLPRHNIQWLFGSFLAELLTNLSSKYSAYVIILGSQALMSLLFLTLPEFKNSKIVRNRSKLKQLLLKQRQSAESGLDSPAKTEEEYRKLINTMTLQCFSLDEEEQDRLFILQEFIYYKENNYLNNVLVTLKSFEKQLTLLSLIVLIGVLQAYLFTNFLRMVGAENRGGAYKPLLSFKSSFYAAFFYVSLGELIGTFSPGFLGKKKDKLKYTHSPI